MSVSFLTILIFVSAVLAILAATQRRLQLVHYIFKPLTVVFIILLALQEKYPVSSFYRSAIIIGLLSSLAGDVFLMLPRDSFIQGLISFLIAHLFYIAAFAHESGWALSLWSVVFLLLYGFLMLDVLLPYLEKLRGPVVIYMLVILLMGCVALSRWMLAGQEGSGLAAAGSLFFIASDSLLAVDRFKDKNFRNSQLLILSTYFTAQWLIALST
jgi:uncharacterized membrane protein YhhN